jgi:hypothetical protein
MCNFLYAICFGLILITVGRCSGEQRMKFEKIEYLSAEMEEAPQTLTVNGTGLVRYESHSNSATPDHPEIGIYETILPGEVEALSQLLDSPPFGDLPDHWGRVMPSDRYKRIRVTTKSGTVEKLVGSAEPIHAKLREIISQLDRIVAETSRHPQQTLRLQLNQTAISAAGELTATLELSNTGIQSLTCRNPVTMATAPDGHLALQVWPDKPQNELRAEDMITVGVQTVTELRPAGVNQTGSSVLIIPSQGSASFQIQTKLAVKSHGRYVIRAEYANTARQLAGKPVIVGEVFSRAVNTNIP